MIPFDAGLAERARGIGLNDAAFLGCLAFDVELYATPLEPAQISDALRRHAAVLASAAFRGVRSVQDGELLTLQPVSDASVRRRRRVTHAELSFRQRCERFLEPALIPSSCEQTGHILRYNLDARQREFRYAIGACALSRTSTTVVSKLQIAEQFRNLEFELIAGRPEYVTTVRRRNYVMQLDFERVYFNNRLQEFHDGVVAMLARSVPPGGLVLDATAGVGPFAIQLAKLGYRVVANDLNPVCCRYLGVNMRLNKVSYTVTNLDARELIAQYAAQDVAAVVANLPEMGYALMRGLARLPRPLCVCEVFERAEGGAVDAELCRRKAACAVAGQWDGTSAFADQRGGAQFSQFSATPVRDVSCGKYMVSLCFRLAAKGDEK